MEFPWQSGGARFLASSRWILTMRLSWKNTCSLTEQWRERGTTRERQTAIVFTRLKAGERRSLREFGMDTTSENLIGKKQIPEISFMETPHTGMPLRNGQNTIARDVLGS